MKNSLKYKILSLCLMLILLSGIFVLQGCGKFEEWYEKDTYFEDEYFRGYVRDDEVILRGLTDLGIEQEELVIPAEVNGLVVNTIGTSIGSELYFIKSKAKKIFLPGKIDVRPKKKMFAASKVIYLSFIPYKVQHTNAFKNIYVPVKAFESYKSIWGEGWVQRANISFMNNYDETLNGGYWWVDHIETGEKIKTVPPVPTREGYTFDGWYTETEYAHKWDFQNDVKGEEEELILYARWVSA